MKQLFFLYVYIFLYFYLSDLIKRFKWDLEIGNKILALVFINTILPFTKIKFSH